MFAKPRVTFYLSEERYETMFYLKRRLPQLVYSKVALTPAMQKQSKQWKQVLDRADKNAKDARFFT
jgi:hypothetical protein